MNPILLVKNHENVDADFFVDSISGKDTNDGLTNRTPFKTCSKLITNDLENKIIAFKTGTWNEKLSLNSINNLSGEYTRIIKYGAGNKPKFSTAKPISQNWINLGGNIWSVQDDAFPSEIANIYISGNRATLGRFPKTGWRSITGSSSTSLTDSALPESLSLNNCEVIYKSYSWSLGKKRANYTDSTRTFTFGSGGYSPLINYGYFIQNHTFCLTLQGEWAYNNVTKTVYMYSMSEPEAASVTYNDSGIDIIDSTNVILENICCDQTNGNSISIYGCDSITISGCDICNSGLDAIHTDLSNNIEVQNCTIENTDSCGIFINNSLNVNIFSNILNNVGVINGKGRSGQLWGIGMNIDLKIDNLIIKNNIIENTGYIGILFSQANNVLVEGNYVSNFNLRMCDGGGIYTWYNNAVYNAPCVTEFAQNKIINNIIEYGLTGDGNTGTNNGVYNSHGVYLDDQSENVLVDGNTVIDAYTGIFVHGGINHVITNNTIYAYSIGLQFSGAYTNNSYFTGNVIQDNLIVIEQSSLRSYTRYGTYAFDVNSSTINYFGNKYYFPFGTESQPNYFSLGGTKNLQQWKDHDAVMDWNRDTEEVITPSLFVNTTKPREDYLLLFTNPSDEIITVEASDLPYTDYIDLDGVAFGSSRQIDKHKSLILVRSE